MPKTTVEGGASNAWADAEAAPEAGASDGNAAEHKPAQAVTAPPKTAPPARAARPKTTGKAP